MSDTRTRVTLVVPSKPGRIFDLLATPYRLADIDPTGSVLSDENAAPVTAEGQEFTMNMVTRDGVAPVKYQGLHHVDAFRHNREIGWRVQPTEGDGTGWSWRFELTPLEGKKKRTQVALVYDWSGTSPDNAARYGIPDRDAADLEAFLARIAREVSK